MMVFELCVCGPPRGRDSVDIERMREFIELSRTMSFTEAARELHMTQPNLSKHVRDMEREAGFELIDRGNVGAQSALTLAGVRFLDYARRAVADYDAVIDDCRAIESAEPSVRLPDIRHVVNVVPQLRFMLSEAGEEAANYVYVTVEGPAREALDSDVVDFAATLEPDADIARLAGEFPEDAYGLIALNPEPIVAMVGSSSPFYRHASISLAELSTCRALRGDNAFFEHARDTLEKMFLAQGCDLAFSAYADHPLRGGAYPLGPNDVNLCTTRFARYYRDVDAEDFSVLEVESFQPEMLPFLVFRKDNDSPAVQRIVRAASDAGALRS